MIKSYGKQLFQVIAAQCFCNFTINNDTVEYVMCHLSSDVLFTQCLRPGKDQMIFPVGKTKEVKQGLLSFFQIDFR